MRHAKSSWKLEGLDDWSPLNARGALSRMCCDGTPRAKRSLDAVLAAMPIGPGKPGKMRPVFPETETTFTRDLYLAGVDSVVLALVVGRAEGVVDVGTIPTGLVRPPYLRAFR